MRHRKQNSIIQTLAMYDALYINVMRSCLINNDVGIFKNRTMEPSFCESRIFTKCISFRHFVQAFNMLHNPVGVRNGSVWIPFPCNVSLYFIEVMKGLKIVPYGFALLHVVFNWARYASLLSSLKKFWSASMPAASFSRSSGDNAEPGREMSGKLFDVGWATKAWMIMERVFFSCSESNSISLSVSEGNGNEIMASSFNSFKQR